MYKIIIVEDEDVIRCGLKEYINWEKYSFHVAGEAKNGKSALELIHEVLPDVVLIDIMMPEMNGIKLLEILNDSYPEIKAVVLSGYSEFDYARQCMELGASAYLLKPAKNSDIERVFLKIKNELDIVHNRKKEMDSILKYAEVGNATLREKVIQGIFEGNLSEINITEQCSQINKTEIEFLDYNCVIIFNIDMGLATEHPPLTYWSKSEIVNGINNCMCSVKNVKCCEVLLKDRYNLIVVISCKDLISKIYTREIALRIKEKLIEIILGTNAHNTIISVGLGNFYKDPIRLKDSYNEAICALKYKFFSGKGLVLHVDDCVRQLGVSDGALEQLNNDNTNILSEIINSTISCDANSLIKSVNNFFNLASLLGNGNEEIIFMKIVEIMVILTMRLNDIHIDFKNIYNKNIHHSIRDIIDNETISELKNWTKDICLKTINIIHSYVCEKKIDPIIEKAKWYIGENYNKKITLEEMCNLLFLSPSYFSAMFRQKTGLTFTQYLTNIRIGKSKEILLTPDIKVYETALMVGYDDFRHFSMLFKKMEGMSPQQYRQLKLSARKDIPHGENMR